MLASCSRNVLKSCLRAPAVVEKNVPAELLKRRGQQLRTAATVHRTKESENEWFRPRKEDDGYSFHPRDPVINRTAMSSPIAKANIELGRLAERRRAIDAFTLCKDMKLAGVKPDSMTYDHLLSLCATFHASTEAWAIFEDMISMDVRPEREAFHHLLNAVWSREITHTWHILDLMAQFDVTPNSTTYELIISRIVHSDNLEAALQRLAEMNNFGLSPTLGTAQLIIGLACKLDMPRLALDLADAFESTAIRRLDPEIWMSCLIASAEALYADGVITCWQKVVHDLNMLPDEGCCLAVLHTIARHHLTALGMDVMHILKAIGVTWEEYHFIPLVEAFAGQGKLKEAFGILELMRTNGIEPAPESALPMFDVISQSIEKLDEAWGVLDELHSEGRFIDVVAVNVAIHAAAILGDLQRAIGIYKVLPDYNVAPNVETFNLLLLGCIEARHRELGDRLLSEMREAGLKPDQTTYERLIHLCTTQPVYEDAFFYLEEMKTVPFKPPRSTYEAIIRKCVSNGDSRYKLAVEEMIEQGYELHAPLKSYIDSGGKNPAPKRGLSPGEERHILEQGWKHEATVDQ